MSDLLHIAMFLVCCAATVGLIVLCERLMPPPPDARSKP